MVGDIIVSGRVEEEITELSRTNSTRPPMPPAPCPNCGHIFKDPSSVLKHMNHRYSSCHLWFSEDPQPPNHMEHPPDTSPPSRHFPNSGHIFDTDPGFLGWFYNNEDTSARSANLYHPFLSKGEWEIAKFLSCSGLSMKLIDEFLLLESVSPSEVILVSH